MVPAPPVSMLRRRHDRRLPSALFSHDRARGLVAVLVVLTAVLAESQLCSAFASTQQESCFIQHRTGTAERLNRFLSNSGPQRLSCFRFSTTSSSSSSSSSSAGLVTASQSASKSTDRPGSDSDDGAGAGALPADGNGTSDGFQYLLGVLMPMHISTSLSDPTTCTGARHVFMVELVEALKLALSEILASSPAVQRLVSGVEVHDSCGMPEAAAEEAIELSRYSIQVESTCRDRQYASAIAASSSCGTLGSPTNTTTTTNAVPTTEATTTTLAEPVEVERLLAVIGPVLSKEVEVATTVLNSYQIPHFSFWSTSDHFVDKDQYPYFFRTTTSDRFQAAAILDLLKHFGWTYVYMLYDEPDGSRDKLADSLRYSALVEHNQAVCFAMDRAFRFTDAETINDILQRWFDASANTTSTLESPHVVLLLAGYRYAEAIFNATEMKARHDPAFAAWLATEHFVWIASDSWISAAVDIVHKTKRAVAMGNHTVIGLTFQVPDNISCAEGFEDRLYAKLQNTHPTEDAILSNPWLAVAWQDRHACRLPFVQCTDIDAECQNRNVCNVTMSVAEAFGLAPDSFWIPITTGSLWMAVKSTVWLIEDMIQAANGSTLGFADKQYEALTAAMRQGAWDCSGAVDQPELCHFFTDQDLSHNLRVLGIVPGPAAATWRLEHLADWHVSSSPVNQSTAGSPLVWREAGLLSNIWMTATKEPPMSACSQPCRPGTLQYEPLGIADGLQRPKACCWLCTECTGNTFRNGSSTDGRCTPCATGYFADENHTSCVLFTTFYYDFATAPGVAVLVLSFLGVCGAVLLLAAFCWHRKRLALRVAGIELSVVLLLTAIIGLSANVYLFSKPGTRSCPVHTTTIANNFVFSLLLLNCRCLRHVSVSNKAGVPGFVVRLAALLASNATREIIGVFSIATVITGVFIVYGREFPIEPTAMPVSETRTLNLYCHQEPLDSISVPFFAFFLLSFIYLAFVVRRSKITRTLGMTWLPNEATLLGLTAFMLTIFWAAVLPIASLAVGIVFPVVSAAAMLLHHFAILACLFVPRIRAVSKGSTLAGKLASRHQLRVIHGVSRQNTISLTQSRQNSMHVVSLQNSSGGGGSSASPSRNGSIRGPPIASATQSRKTSLISNHHPTLADTQPLPDPAAMEPIYYHAGTSPLATTSTDPFAESPMLPPLEPGETAV